MFFPPMYLVELRACIFTIALRYCNTIYLKAQEKFYKHHKLTAVSAFFLQHPPRFFYLFTFLL